MATIDPVPQQDIERAWIERYVYPNVTESDVCAPLKHPEYGEITMQSHGTFGAGGRVDLMGTLDGDPDSSNYTALLDLHTGSAIQQTALARQTAFNSAYYVKPVIGAGTGVSVTITLYFQAPRRRGN